MKRLRYLSLLMICAACMPCMARTVETGPYTVSPIAKNVWHILEHGVNPSDIYLVTGGDKALLIDLSNRQEGAEEALRRIVAERIGRRELTVTVTHDHFDHTGMSGAFINDPTVKFLLPAADFYGSRNAGVFPPERTTYFDDGYRIDLGKGVAVNTLTVAGHTRGSTVFFLEGQNICFSGDAIGSGSGVWIFDYDGLLAYSEAVPRLNAYINDPAHGIDRSKLVFHGGHSLQKGDLPFLGHQYLDDMLVLLDRMAAYSAESVPVNFGRHRLNRNYNFGQAWITCCDLDAVRYHDRCRFPEDKDVIGRGPTHRAQHAELIARLDEHRTTIDGRVGEMKYYLYDPIRHGADPGRKYPLVVIFHGANNGHNGVQCASDSDCYTFLSDKYQAELGGAYVLFPKANEGVDDGSEPKVGTWMTFDPETGKSIYIPSVKGIIDEVMANSSIDPDKVIVGGTSAGGFMTWQFLIDNYTKVAGAFLMAPAFTPTKEQLDNYEAAGLPLWIIHGRKDAICQYGRTTGPNEERFRTMPAVRLSVLETVRYGDKGMVYFSPDPASDRMGQHLALFAVGQNMIYDDGTPYDPRYPEGVTGWMRAIFDRQT